MTSRHGTQRAGTTAPAAPRFPRLFALARRDGQAVTLDEHLERHGPPPVGLGSARGALVEEILASGLRGRGGGGFPTGLKLEAVASRPGNKVVVANGSEGEPTSLKDKALLRLTPHLVLDGVALAAHAVGAGTAIVVVGRAAATERAAIAAALEERRRLDIDRVAIRVADIPDRFVAGEETAVVQWLNGGPAKPTITPPRPFERGVGGRPTLVQNVETMAQIALIARYGSAWFREVGTPDEPGTVLVTVLGAVRRPGVREVALGQSLEKVIESAGGASEPVGAYLIGGYFGTWIAADNRDVALTDAALRPLGGALGARAIAVLPAGRCGLAEAARVTRYLADESAGQCGPCRFGLPAIADAMGELLTTAASPKLVAQIERWAGQVSARGACRHPDGAARFVMSALAVFQDEVALHVAGRCSGHDRQPLLPLSAAPLDGWQ